MSLLPVIAWLICYLNTKPMDQHSTSAPETTAQKQGKIPDNVARHVDRIVNVEKSPGSQIGKKQGDAITFQDSRQEGSWDHITVVDASMTTLHADSAALTTDSLAKSG